MIVRPAAPADAAAVSEVYAPWVEATAVSFEAEPPDADEMRCRLLARPRLPWLVAERDGQVVGWAGAVAHKPRAAYRWTAETSVYLRQDAQGRGTGRWLYEVLLDELTALGLVTALAVVTLPNPASVALHERLGFRQVGRLDRVGFKHGTWRDVGWWQKDLVARPDAPPEPREWQAHDTRHRRSSGPAAP